jgi:hypothetical protein
MLVTLLGMVMLVTEVLGYPKIGGQLPPTFFTATPFTESGIVTAPPLPE